MEDKGERAKLIFIGVSEKTFDEVGKSYGIQNKEDVYFLDCTISSTKEKCTEPVWEDAYTEQERNLCKALKDGPLMLQEAADAVGKDLFPHRTSGKRGYFNQGRLLQEAAWESKKITGLSEKNHKNICKKFRLKGIYLYFAYYAI